MERTMPNKSDKTKQQKEQELKEERELRIGGRKHVKNPVEQRSPHSQTAGGKDPDDYPEGAGPLPVGNAPVRPEKESEKEIQIGVEVGEENMKNRSDTESRKQQAENPKSSGGSPGEGKGRKEEAKGSGVYPASGPLPSGQAGIRTQAERGQGDHGAEGYEDHGGSEVHILPPESEEAVKAVVSGAQIRGSGNHTLIRERHSN